MKPKKNRSRRETTIWKPALKRRYGPLCYICRGRFEDSDLTVDHIIPVSQGGEATLSNLRLCCRECNEHKGAFEGYMSTWRYKDPNLLPTDKQLVIMRAAWHYFVNIVNTRMVYTHFNIRSEL